MANETIERRETLDYLLRKSQILEKEPRLNPWLCRVLITELLWGAKKLPPVECKPIKTVLAYKQIFAAHYSNDVEEDVERSKGRLFYN